MGAVTGISTIVWLAGVVSVADARRAAPRLVAGARAAGTQLVSVIIPARNEQRDLDATLRSVEALDDAAIEIIVVDDESTDATWSLIGDAEARDARVRGVRGAPLPAGWVGKQWAIQQGVNRSRGAWLLFSDADVLHAPASLTCALALAERQGADAVSLAPRVANGSFGARLISGAAISLIAAYITPHIAVQAPRVPVALAAGGYILVRRGAYDAAGGHAAIRDRMIDDVALALALKRAGTPVLVAPAGDLVRVRMYGSFREAVAGWRKSAAHGLRGPRIVPAVAAVSLVAAAAAAPAAVVVGIMRHDQRLVRRGVTGWAAASALRGCASVFCPAGPLEVLCAPAGFATVGLVALASIADRVRGGSSWRGRRYPFAQ